MRFPRPLSSRTAVIEALPSIYTAFPIYYDGNSSSSSTASPGNEFDEGLELVPIERSEAFCAMILTPGPEEKEVVPNTLMTLPFVTKPLPDVPEPSWIRMQKVKWDMMSVKWRLLIIFGVQLAILISIIVGLKSAKGKTTHSQSQKASVPDGRPISGDVPPIKRGTFALALGNPSQQSSNCLAMNNQSAAWSCSTNITIRIDILPSVVNQARHTAISIGLFPRGGMAYGLQNPGISFTELTPSTDPEFPQKGMAYHFQAMYNRTVLIREDQLPLVGDRIDSDDTPVQPGDHPWLCYFPDTYIEGFLYVNETSSSSGSTFPYTNIDSNTTTPYLPYVVKLGERASNRTRPYCDHMTGNGNLPTEMDTLFLTEASVEAVSADPKNGTRGVFSRQQIPFDKSCQCQWMIQ